MEKENKLEAGTLVKYKREWEDIERIWYIDYLYDQEKYKVYNAVKSDSYYVYLKDITPIVSSEVDAQIEWLKVWDIIYNHDKSSNITVKEITDKRVITTRRNEKTTIECLLYPKKTIADLANKWKWIIKSKIIHNRKEIIDMIAQEYIIQSYNDEDIRIKKLVEWKPYRKNVSGSSIYYLNKVMWDYVIFSDREKFEDIIERQRAVFILSKVEFINTFIEYVDRPRTTMEKINNALYSADLVLSD